MSPVMQYADEIHDAAYEIRVYRGADGVFPLYEDEGDNYNFESGRFSIVMLRWSELDGELIIAERAGDFEGMVTSRQLHIVFIPKAAGSRAASFTTERKYVCVQPTETGAGGFCRGGIMRVRFSVTSMRGWI